MFRTCITRSLSVNGTPRVICLAILVLLIALPGCGKVEMTDVEYVERAKDYQDKGDLRASVIDLKNALRKNPENLEARWLLGSIYVELGNGPAAEKELQRAHELGVVRESVIVPLAKALQLQGKQKKLLEDIKVLAGLAPDVMSELYFLRGKAFVALGDLDQASAEFQSALDIQQDSTSAWLGQGLLAFINRRWDDANKWSLKVLEVSPTSDEALALRGDTALAQGDFTAAVKAYQLAVDNRPGIPQYRVALAIAQINTGELDKAIGHLDLLLKINPNHVTSNYFRAVAAYQKRDFDAAQLFAEKVLNVGSGHLPSRLIAGAANYLLGNLEKRKVIFRSLLRRRRPTRQRASYSPQLSLS